MDLIPSVVFRPEITNFVAQLIPPTFIPHTNIPVRSAGAKTNCLDLTQHYNALLTVAWHGAHEDNDLRNLGVGLLHLDGVEWDARGD